MTDPTKNDAQTILDDVKAETAKLETDAHAEFGKGEQAGEVWVKAHTAWIAGVTAFVVGVVCGLLVHLV